VQGVRVRSRWSPDQGAQARHRRSQGLIRPSDRAASVHRARDCSRAKLGMPHAMWRARGGRPLLALPVPRPGEIFLHHLARFDGTLQICGVLCPMLVLLQHSCGAAKSLA
jgi:hypothetical protein